ncbi:hypothetical protein DFJ74DRAFT_649757 [Hyaloraphidium curvatum]|nr:hypothetical protein DFJ74DRAFT_649757 [Hyaloraphidium curvatum]
MLALLAVLLLGLQLVAKAQATGLAVPTRPPGYSYEEHDCYDGPPDKCAHPLKGDRACRGKVATSSAAWRDITCDYLLYDGKARKATKNWIVIHAGGPDTYTENLGDYFSARLGSNLWGLRPCSGFSGSACEWYHNGSLNDALHVSWLMANKDGSFVTFPPVPGVSGWPSTGVINELGLNPPALVDAYHTPGAKLLFLHEYGTMNSYAWQYVAGYNKDTQPIFICVGMVDPLMNVKFAKVKQLLESGFESALPYRVEVINTVTGLGNDTVSFGPAVVDVPCTGILREYSAMNRRPAGQRGNVNWAWEQPDTIINVLLDAINAEQTTGRKSSLVKKYEKAMQVVWCGTEKCVRNIKV